MQKPNGAVGGPSHRTYLLLLLALLAMINGLDIQAVNLALPSIKTALHLTDMELGVLTGIAFSFFYSILGIPIGRWADRGNRITIIALTGLMRGIMVVSVAATRSFAELLVVRAGAAIGEAGLFPTAFSLIADYFPREERPRAVAKFLMGSCLSAFVANSCEGWLISHFGWRRTFVCIGIPGLVIALLVWRTASEPRGTRGQAGSVCHSPGSPTLVQGIRLLWRTRTFRYILAMQSAATFFATGMVVWEPSFFYRSYLMEAEQIGVYFALVYGAGALIGTYGGAYLATRYAARNESLQLKLFALVNGALGLVWACVYLSKEVSVSLAALFFAFGLGTVQNGSVFATIQTVVPENVRAMSISIVLLFANLVGAGLGPLAIGLLSDALYPRLGAESLRYGLLASCPGYLLVCWFMWRAATTVNADLDAVTRREDSSRRPLPC